MNHDKTKPEIRWAENSVACAEHSIRPDEDCFVCMIMVGPQYRKLKEAITEREVTLTNGSSFAVHTTGLQHVSPRSLPPITGIVSMDES